MYETEKMLQTVSENRYAYVSATRFAVRLAVIACCLAAHTSQAIDDVGGTLITLTNSSTAPNGVWSWFEDERAIIDDTDPNNTLLLVSSVSYAASGSERGDVDLLWLNIDTGSRGEFELKDRLEVPDDHNSASLWRRPSDGRYVAMYSTHNNDDFSRYRISTNPGDPKAWQPETLIDNNAPTTYSNLYHLPNEGGSLGRTYNFTRASNFDPTILVSTDQGSSWTSNGFKLVNQGSSSQRPYARYAADDNRIHVTITEEHPRNFDNSIYHAYIEDGRLFSSSGSMIDANLFDGNALDPNELTAVFSSGTNFDGVSMQHAWTTDVAIDANGNPITVFTARADNSTDDHRLLYATFDGTDWQVSEVAKMGAGLYSPEDDYTGLASIDPNTPNTLFVSTNIDPRSDQQMAHYEIFRGATADGGESWNWEPITFNSTVDNLRPLVPEWSSDETALVWMRGTYNTFQNWDSKVVVLTDISPITNQPSIADLSGNGSVGVEDFAMFMSNLFLDISTLTQEQATALGDFNGDLKIDYADFVLFEQQFDIENGAGTLQLATAIPEPPACAALSMVFPAVVIWCIKSRH